MSQDRAQHAQQPCCNRLSNQWRPKRQGRLIGMTATILVAVASGQSDPTVGVGTQGLPNPTDEYGSESSESGGLLKGSRRRENT